MVHSAKMGGALKILERMVNQNAEDEIFQDFKYWEVRQIKPGKALLSLTQRAIFARRIRPTFFCRFGCMRACV